MTTPKDKITVIREALEFAIRQAEIDGMDRLAIKWRSGLALLPSVGSSALVEAGDAMAMRLRAMETGAGLRAIWDAAKKASTPVGGEQPPLQYRHAPRSQGPSVEEAMRKLENELKADTEYRYGWQANIAMAFYDHFCRAPEFSRNEPLTHNRLHELANGAAIAFLEQLAPTKDIPDVPGAMAVALIHDQAAKDSTHPNNDK